jgi:uncharacterized protein YybS (DUF2232 family)
MGGSDSGTRVGVHILLLVALTTTLFAAAGYIPILGIIVSLLAPTPLLLVILRYGQQAGLLALGLSTVSLTLLLGLFQGAIFLAEYGVMALTMAEAIRRKWPIERLLLASTVVPLLSTALVIAMLLSSTDIDFAAIRQHIEQDLGQALPQQLTEGDKALDSELRSYIEEAVSVAIRLLPALLILSTALSASLNYSLVRYIWQRRGDADMFPEVALARWKAPDVCIWVFIAGGLCAIAPQTSVQTIGMNVLLLIGLLYVVQGLGILVFYFQKTSVPPLFRAIVYLFLVIQPLLLLGVAAFGLFDLWFDFRRLHHKREELP